MKKTGEVLKKKNYHFWDMYLFLNMNHFKNGAVFSSKKNGKKYKLVLQKRTAIQKVLSSILWLTPSIILIYLVATLQMHYTTAIACIIAFHFLAFWYIIRTYPIWKKLEKTS